MKPLDHVDVKVEALPTMVGHSAVQGWRMNMEDRHIISDLRSLPGHSLLAIFDGHSGTGAADYCASSLVDTLQRTASWKAYVQAYQQRPAAAASFDEQLPAKKRKLQHKLGGAAAAQEAAHDDVMTGLLSKALVEAYIALDNDFLQSLVADMDSSVGKRPNHLQRREPLTAASMANTPGVPEDIAEQLRQNLNGGCTAVCALVTPTYVVVANCGDSRCIISGCVKASSNGSSAGASSVVQYTTVSMTEDHKPSIAEEEERIEQAGGFVADDRVDGELAMSRAIGDYRYKLHPLLSMMKQKVICVPDVAIYRRTHQLNLGGGNGAAAVADSPADLDTSDLIILACDGVAEAMDDNVDVVRVVRDMVNEERVRRGAHGVRYSEVARRLIKRSVSMRSTDNISVIVAPLHPPRMEVATKISSS